MVDETSGVLLLPEKVITDIRKKIKHNIVKPIHSSFKLTQNLKYT